METKKRTYTKRSAEEKKERLTTRLMVLKAAHATRAKLIATLEAKVNTNPPT